MRNLKRAFSLVLAMVMLVGMMAINTNAASNFADADEIVNKEAVAITAGMGLFAGSDGKFNPKGNVTRAQMATIIVKMLRGSDFNADAFKGAANPFTDTAAFEGGWAEGYINACFQMGVVKGYGDGTFKPGNSVTTAEAVTMIINALKVDAGAGEWPLTVMAKATEMKLFGELNPAPATNEALIRDQLAVITLEGLQYSDSGKSGYTVEGMTFVFDNMSDALKAAGYDATKITEVVGDDTLAGDIYSLSVVTGFVSENKATGAEYTVVADETFDIETGLDMIGHYVSVYYKAPAAGEYVDAYEAYAVVEESTTVVVAEDIDSSKEYKTAFGRNYDLAAELLILDGEYAEVDSMDGAVPYTAGSSAPKGTYIIYENKVIAFLQPGTPVASQILAITDFDGEKTYSLAGVDNPIDEANITIYGGAKKEDYVTYTMAGGQYVLSPVDPVKGTASKYATDAEGTTTITINGTAYPLFAEDNATDLDANPADLVLTTEQYTFYMTQDGKIVGWTGAAGSSTDVNVDDIVYALGYFKLESKSGNYGEKVKKYFLQGVNTEGDEAHVLIAVEYDNNKDGVYGGEGDDATLGNVPETEALREGFYLTSDHENEDSKLEKDAKKEGVKDYIRIGVKDERNAATGNLFYGLNRYGSSGENSISWPSSYANNHVCSTACAGEDPAKHNNTIVSGAGNHSGSADDNTSNKTTRTFFGSDVKYVMIDGVLGEQLKTDAGGSDFKWTLPGSEGMKHVMLFKLNEVGATEVVMIAIRKDPDDLKASTSTIFVADATPSATSADGDLYTVYTASSGKAQEVVLHGTDGISAPAVGFWSYKVEEDGSWTQMYRSSDPENTGYDQSKGLQELYFMGLFDGKTVSATFADGSIAPYITGADASGAKIVDLRSEAQKSEEGITTITSVEQLANLAESGKLVSVYIWDKGRTTTGCIYVNAITNNPTGVVFLPAIGASTAYTMTGSTAPIATTGSSNLAGFVRVKNMQGAVTLEQVTGDKYYDGVVATSLTDGVLATDGGNLKVNDNTVIVNLSAMDIEDMDDMATAIASYKLTISGVCEAGKAASIIFVTGMVDEMINDGDYVWIDSALLATNEAGKVTALLGGKDGPEHDIYYNAVTELSGMGKEGGAYYLIGKAESGAVTLTRSCTYFQEQGDILFLTSKASAAGKVCTAIVVDAASAEPGETVYYIAAAKASNAYQTERFAVVKSGGGMTFWQGTVSKYMAGLDGKIGVHEAITAVGADTFTMGAFSDGSHAGGTTCHWCSTDSSYVKTSPHNYKGNGYIMGSYGAVACENAGTECAATQGFDENTAVVNYSEYTVTGTTVAEQLASIKTLCDELKVMVDVYAPDGTAEVVIVRNFCPNGDECDA